MNDKYQYRFIRKRQIPDIPISLQKKYDEAFGKLMDFLKNNLTNKNPLSNLVKRKDVFSTIELIEFALAVEKMNQIDSDWIKQQLRLATSKNVNNAYGAITEILTLGSLCESGVYRYKLKPAPSGNPGIDGYLIYDNGIEVGISIKHYGESYHQKVFREKCEEICSEFERNINKDGFSIQVSIDFNSYPNTKSWEKIDKYLSFLIKSYQKATRKLIAILSVSPRRCLCIKLDEDIHIVFSPLNDVKQYPGMPSYILNIWARSHPNDFKGILDKIQLAEDNLDKYFVTADNKRSVLFIHMPNSYPLDALSETIITYLSRPTCKIDYIILYTAVIAYDTYGGKAVYHVIKLYTERCDTGIGFQFLKAYGRVIDEIPFPRYNKGDFPEIKDRYFFNEGRFIN